MPISGVTLFALILDQYEPINQGEKSWKIQSPKSIQKVSIR
jgi:hypothetical protein